MMSQTNQTIAFRRTPLVQVWQVHDLLGQLDYSQLLAKGYFWQTAICE